VKLRLRKEQDNENQNEFEGWHHRNLDWLVREGFPSVVEGCVATTAGDGW
jgi:hypothetical protein